jgi:hypothetical protein
MKNTHSVFEVVSPIPELGALTGDMLYAEPAESDTPLVLIRNYAADYLPFTADQRVSFVSGVRPSQPAPSGTSALDIARNRWGRCGLSVARER